MNYLKEFPTMGRESGYEGIRYLIVRDYLVFYKNCKDLVTILRVWDGRRDPGNIAKSGCLNSINSLLSTMQAGQIVNVKHTHHENKHIDNYTVCNFLFDSFVSV